MQTKPNKGVGLSGKISNALGLALLTAVTGCVGYAGGDYGGVGYGGAVVAPVPVPPPPDVFLFGGDFDREHHDYHSYGRRGSESRGEAHGRWHGR